MLKIGSTQDSNDMMSVYELHSPNVKSDGDFDQFVASIFDVPEAMVWELRLLSNASARTIDRAAKSGGPTQPYLLYASAYSACVLLQIGPPFLTSSQITGGMHLNPSKDQDVTGEQCSLQARIT